jgi:hypothetical protein
VYSLRTLLTFEIMLSLIIYSSNLVIDTFSRRVIRLSTVTLRHERDIDQSTW